MAIFWCYIWLYIYCCIYIALHCCNKILWGLCSKQQQKMHIKMHSCLAVNVYLEVVLDGKLPLWSVPTTWGFGSLCCNRIGVGGLGVLVRDMASRDHPPSPYFFFTIILVVAMLTNTLDAHQHLPLEETTLEKPDSSFITWCMCIAAVWSASEIFAIVLFFCYK